MAVPGKFTPVQRSAVPQGPPPQSKGGIPPFPIFAIILYAVYLGVMIIGPKFISTLADELDPMIPPLWRLVGAGLLFLILASIIVATLLKKPKTGQEGPPSPKGIPGPSPSTRTQSAPAGSAAAKFKPVMADRKSPKEETPKQVPKKVEDEPPRSQVVAYPLEVEGGIFGDTYIQLSPNKVLKLRSMVVEPKYLS
jgi:hypothetical protein